MAKNCKMKEIIDFEEYRWNRFKERMEEKQYLNEQEFQECLDFFISKKVYFAESKIIFSQFRLPNPSPLEPS